MKIQDVMTSPVRCCTPGDSLSVAAQAMWEGDFGCLPVVDGESKLVGMITDRDLAMATHLCGAPLWMLRVEDAMAKLVFFVRAGDKLRAAAKLMSEHQLRRLPVVDADGRLLGMVTLAALAQLAADTRRKSSLSAKDVFAVFAAVTTPRAPVLEAPIVVEVKREEPAPEPKNVIQPAPRKNRKSAVPAAKKPKKARAAK